MTEEQRVKLILEAQTRYGNMSVSELVASIKHYDDEIYRATRNTMLMKIVLKVKEPAK